MMKTLDDDTISNFVQSLLDGLNTAKFYLSTPTLNALKTVNKLKAQQLEADEKGSFTDGELTINKDYVILTAHKWDDWTPSQQCNFEESKGGIERCPHQGGVAYGIG